MLESRLADLTLSHEREREAARKAAVEAELTASKEADSGSDSQRVQPVDDRQMDEMKEKDRIHLEEIKLSAATPRA